MKKSPKSGYLPGLDGWRAFSILAVMFTHDYPYRFGSHGPFYVQTLGGTGVLMFFAISGLLICTRLLEEKRLLGSLNLRGFYLRRVLRIQPAAITFLVAVALLTASGWIVQSWRYWFGAFFLFRNYQWNLLDPAVVANGYFTGHFWTLAVEEHFYLLLSVLLFLVTRRRLLWMSILLAAFVVWPHILNRWPGFDPLVTGNRTTGCQIQFLLLPALVATWLQLPAARAWVEKYLVPWAAFSVTAVLAAMLYYAAPWMGHHALLVRTVPSPTELLIHTWPFWIVAAYTHPQSLTTRFLELPLLRWIGKLSYSLYLWHVLFFRGPWPDGIPQPHSPLVALSHAPWNFIASFVLAALSFYLVEKPLMRLGHRLAPPVTPGRTDMQDEPSVKPELQSA